MSFRSSLSSLFLSSLLFAAAIFCMPARVSAAPCVSISNYLTYGSTDESTNGEVSLLQNFLRLNEPSGATLSITGFFDITTQSAVAAWQRSEGIVSSGSPATTGYGAVGPRTRASIANCARVTPTPFPTPTPTPSGTLYRSLSYGSYGPDVSILQTLLGADITVYPEQIISGFFGRLTEAAVQRFQVKYGIVTSGTPLTTGFGAVGPRTRAALLSGNPLPPPPPVPTPIPTPGPRSCTVGSSVLPSGTSQVLYSQFYVQPGQACTTFSQLRTCTDGFLSGGNEYQYNSCTSTSASSCIVGGIVVPDGTSATYYSQSTVPSGASCSSYAQLRTCSNGSLSGSYPYATCLVTNAASCTFNGTTVPDGSSVTAYQSATVPVGSTCTSQTRTCSNGSLSGTYTNASCIVGTDTVPPSASFTAPLSGATVSGTVTLSATASDNIGIVGVTFKVDSVLIGSEDTLTPYSVSWNTTSLSNGTHTLSATARDVAGNTVVTNRTVTVNNTVASHPFDLSFISLPTPKTYWIFDGLEASHDITSTGATESNAKKVGTYQMEGQRIGVFAVAGGIASNDSVVIDKGLKAYEWAFAQMASDGSFPLQGDVSTTTGPGKFEDIHPLSFLLESAARSVMLIRAAPVNASFKARAEALVPKLLLAAQHMNHQPNLDNFYTNGVDTNMLTTPAAAFKEIAYLTGDSVLSAQAKWMVEKVLARQYLDGTFPEKPKPSCIATDPRCYGFDTVYQSVSLDALSRYASLVTDPVWKATVIAAIKRGTDKLLTKVDAITGKIDTSTNSRTTACGAPQTTVGPTPKSKGIDIIPLRFYYFGLLFGNANMYASIADKIQAYGQSFDHIEQCTDTLFFDAGDGSTGAWSNLYFKDGATAQVTNTPDGLLMSSPSTSIGNNDHLVLWTKKKFSGPVKMTFEYKRLDTPGTDARASIIIFHSQGIANMVCPVDGITRTTTDIQTWSRTSPAYEYYHQCMDNQSVNFDAMPGGTAKVSFRQNRGFNLLSDAAPAAGLQTNVWYSVEIIRSATNLVVTVKTTAGVPVYSYTSANFLASQILSNDGYLGIRGMSGRQALYKNISVYAIY